MSVGTLWRMIAGALLLGALGLAALLAVLIGWML